MRNFLGKLNELQRTLLLAAVIGLVFILFSFIGLIFGQCGWLIGVVLGTITELINILLLFKGSEFILNENKAGLFLLFFFLRMILAVITFFICVYLDFKLCINAFHNSIWGAVIGFAPIEIVVLIISSKNKAKPTVEVK